LKEKCEYRKENKTEALRRTYARTLVVLFVFIYICISFSQPATVFQ